MYLKKIDYKKEYIQLYSAKQNIINTVIVPEVKYLKVSGGGGPASEDWKNAIVSLYPLAYTIKFMSKEILNRDYVVMPLEGLWYMEDMSKFSEKLKMNGYGLQ